MSTRMLQGRAGALVSTALGALCLNLLVAAPASAVCVGDCNGDGTVAINELITGVNIALGSQPVSACPAFANESGEVNIAQLIKGVNNALNGCPVESTPTATDTVVVPPTATATGTPAGTTATQTPTETPVPGNEIGTQECTLVSGATASRVKLNAGTLPFPPFPMSGKVEVSCGAVAGGEASCSCAVKNLDPINIPGIGFVCISASADPCPDGKIACDGGTSLGVSVQANANVGTCDGNAACATLCESHCSGLGLEVASPPQCTGFCNGGERDGQSCNCDTAGARCQGDDCPGGACNGPDNAQANPDICQCQCIDRSAGAEQRKGEMSCNLPVTLVVETGAPCGNGDVLINVGSACSPLTTSAASSVIDNANYIADNIVPAGPCENNEGTAQTPTVLCTNASNCLNPDFPVCGAGPAMSDGAPLSCDVLHNSASGLKLRGMLNFFGSTLGDLVSELYVDCQ